jgi:ABC-type dipeptide/oligopeptide/nickel transport system permease component
VGSYVVRRILMFVPVAWVAATLLFLAFFVVPGDPVQLLVGDKAVSTGVRVNLEAHLGLDQPWYTQYARFWGRLATGDLGESYRTGREVRAIVADAAPASLRLAFWAVVVEIGIGIGTGVFAAAKRRSFTDALVTVSTVVLLAIPAFVLGYLLISMLGVYTFRHDLPRWARFPVQGIGPDSWTFFVIPTGTQWRYLALPVVTLASVHAALVARITRGSLIEVMDTDYMRTAAAKGLGLRAILLKHGLRNVLGPVVTLIGLDVAELIGAAVLTEAVFNWPGLGGALAGAVRFLDAPTVLGISLVLVLTYAVTNLLVDLSYGAFDPRIRYRAGDGQP